MWTNTIELVAKQLCHPLGISDYDVAFEVAIIYVQIRIKDSIEECRKYHFDRLTLRMMPQNQIKKDYPATNYYSGASKAWARSWKITPNITYQRWLRTIWNRDTIQELKIILKYITLKRGIRSPQWKIYALALKIKNPTKEIITLRDKLNDIKLIPIQALKRIIQRDLISDTDMHMLCWSAINW